jgi:hypothetical protein
LYPHFLLSIYPLGLALLLHDFNRVTLKESSYKESRHPPLVVVVVVVVVVLHIYIHAEFWMTKLGANVCIPRATHSS